MTPPNRTSPLLQHRYDSLTNFQVSWTDSERITYNIYKTLHTYILKLLKDQENKTLQLFLKSHHNAVWPNSFYHSTDNLQSHCCPIFTPSVFRLSFQHVSSLRPHQARSSRVGRILLSHRLLKRQWWADEIPEPVRLGACPPLYRRGVGRLPHDWEVPPEWCSNGGEGS